jgi:hypothetical protein
MVENFLSNWDEEICTFEENAATAVRNLKVFVIFIFEFLMRLLDTSYA